MKTRPPGAPAHATLALATALFALGLAGSGHAIPRTPLEPQGLKGEWNFAETSGTSVADSSGGGATGTLAGGAVRTMGKIGVGVCLNGVDGAVRLPDNLPTLQSVGAASVTAWIKMSSLPANGAFMEVASFSVGAADPTNVSRLAMAIRGDGTAAADLFVGGRSTDSESQQTALGDANMGIDQWYLVTGVVEFGAGTIKVYRGSALLVTQSVTFASPTTPSTPSRSSTLGAQDAGSGNPFAGCIDEVKVYNRALSQAEIERLATGDGLRSQWKMDEGASGTTADASGNNFTGTLQGGTAWSGGLHGGGLSFDGVNDYVSLDDHNSVLRNVNGATVAAWIKPASIIPAGSFRELVSVSVNAANPTPVSRVALALRGDETAGDLFSGGRSADSETQKSLTDNSSLAVGEWTHVTGVISFSEGTITIYKNGIQTATGSAPFSQGHAANSLSRNAALGAQDDGSGGNFYHGEMDDVRIYGRALSAREVQDLVMKDCLTAHWKFDENAGTTAADASGNGVTGTLTNGATWAPGQSGSAVSLDGVDDYVALPNDLDVLRKAPAATLAGWVKLQSLPASGAFKEIISIAVGGTPSNLSRAALAVRGDGTAADVFAGGRSTDSEAQQTHLADANLQAGVFYHLAAVLDFSGDSIKVFVNGSLVSQALVNFSQDRTPDTASANGALGAQDLGDANFVNAILDDLRIYCRPLSSAEIQLLATSAPPPAPTNLTATPGDTTVTLNWTASAGATSYNVYRRLSNTSYGAPIANTPQTTYEDMGLTNGTEYFYVVRAVNAAGESGPSNEVSAIPGPTGQPPAKPVITTPPKKTNDTTPGLVGTADPNVTITILFNGVAESQTTTSDFMGNWSFEPSPKADGAYTVRARASNSFGTSPDSDPVTITVDTFVNPPSNVTATPFNGKVHVNWSASPDSDVIGYEVFRSEAGGPFGRIHTGLITVTTYCDSQVTNDVQYCYQIRAVDNTLQEAP